MTYLRFHGGTLVLEDISASQKIPSPLQIVKGKPLCPAHHYAGLLPWLQKSRIRDLVAKWKVLDLRLDDPRQPHSYQNEALEAWLQANGRGGVVLPTGAGKTFLAIQAIYKLNASTLIVVPTIDLLHQWYARLVSAFPNTEIGVFFGLEKIITDLTITTYHSGSNLVANHGDTFKLLVFDEVHHLPAPVWNEIGLMSAAPHHLGLTATYPVSAEDAEPLFDNLRSNKAHKLDTLIEPLVYAKRADELSGRQLAEYRTIRVRVDLTPEEREIYDSCYAEYTSYMHKTGLRESHGPGWWGEYTRRSAYDVHARRSKVSERRLHRIVANAHQKRKSLDDLLKEHATEQILVFTEHNELVYDLSREHLIPAITHQTKAAERKAILDGFKSGDYRVIVTSRVLNEGIDVPEARIAIILGGSASAREYIQRLGRILRRRDNKTALLYEVITRGTIEEGISQRRRRKTGYEIGK